MRDFLNGLDNLHEYMRFSYPKLKPPSFFVEKETADGITLHYRSKRKGYMSYVKGQLRQVGKVFYNLDVDVRLISEAIESDLTHVVFDLRFKNAQYKQLNSSVSMGNQNKAASNKPSSFNLPVKSDVFFELFPFHIVFNRSMNVVSIGSGLAQAIKNVEGENMRDLFNLNRPLIPLLWDNVTHFFNDEFCKAGALNYSNIGLIF
jgi:guanylate cyclase